MNKLDYLKITIIVPVHNAEKTLERCVMSIINQNYTNMECILIENGSSDNSLMLLKDYEQKYESVLAYVSESNGVSAARNLGLKKASGDIIGFCDADDFLEKDVLKTIVEEFSKDINLACLIGGFYIGNVSRQSVTKVYRGLKDQYIAPQKAIKLTIMNDFVMGSVWNKYYRYDSIRETYFDINLSYCEDMHFNVLALSKLHDKNIKIIKEPLYCYTDNSDSVTHQSDQIFDEHNELKYIVALKKILIDSNLDQDTIEQIKMKISCFAIDNLQNDKMQSCKKEKLILELKENFKYLLKNVWRYNWKWNFKRVFYGLKLLLFGV